MTYEPILWLDDPDCRDAHLTGNKAATLAQLRGRGYPVPDGFCVTVRALEDGIWREAAGHALGRLEPPWVVRSSSTSEDSADRAFPGLFTTVLDVPDIDSLLAAVETVVASLTSDAVASYVNHHEVSTQDIRMAVLVQTLVSATSAGVAFGRDPVTGEDVISVEANYGLGEPVVDGSIIPDSFQVTRAGTVTTRRLGTKRQKVVATTSRGRVKRVETSRLEQGSFVLTNNQVRDVAELVQRLERDMAHPVDVEWAFRGEELVLLQARPITTTGRREVM